VVTPCGVVEATAGDEAATPVAAGVAGGRTELKIGSFHPGGAPVSLAPGAGEAVDEGGTETWKSGSSHEAPPTFTVAEDADVVASDDGALGSGDAAWEAGAEASGMAPAPGDASSRGRAVAVLEPS
jgi:hypothetical protein